MFYINIAGRNKYLEEIVGRVEQLLCAVVFRVLDFSFFKCFSKTKRYRGYLFLSVFLAEQIDIWNQRKKRPPSPPTQCAGTSWAAQRRLSQRSTSCLISSLKRPSSNLLLLLSLTSAQAGETKLHRSALFFPGGGRTTHEHGQQRESNLHPVRRGDSEDAQDV